MNFMSVGGIQAQDKQSLIRKNYNHLYAHESAHKRAAGALGGPIVIKNNAEGIPMQGYVTIELPKVDKKHPEKTIEEADVVIKAAMAPEDPSAQDYRVAQEAREIKQEAERIKNKKRLDFYA